MECPYCGITFSLDGVDADNCFPKFRSFHPYSRNQEVDEEEKEFSITSHKCPECKEQVMWLNEIISDENANREIASTILLYPKRPIKRIPKEVPEDIAKDLKEAFDTLEISPKASAALSRRCLQNIIRKVEGITENTLYAEINKLLKLNKLPKYLADDLDSIRIIGNFAAHPTKDVHTGEIVDVESGEAEWTIEVLEDLIGHCPNA